MSKLKLEWFDKVDDKLYSGVFEFDHLPRTGDTISAVLIENSEIGPTYQDAVKVNADIWKVTHVFHGSMDMNDHHKHVVLFIEPENLVRQEI